jgi:hypothetical protein
MKTEKNTLMACIYPLYSFNNLVSATKSCFYLILNTTKNFHNLFIAY